MKKGTSDNMQIELNAEERNELILTLLSRNRECLKTIKLFNDDTKFDIRMREDKTKEMEINNQIIKKLRELI